MYSEPAATDREPAIPRRAAEPLPRAAKIVLALVVLAVGVAQGFGRFTYPLVLPAIDRDLLHSYSLAGWLGTANLAAYLLGTLLVSMAATKVCSARLIQGGMILTCFGLACLIVAPNAGALLGGMVATGIAGAFIWIPAPGLAGSFVSEERRGFIIGLMASGIGIAVLFASQLTRFVRTHVGESAWREVWAVETALAVVATILALVWLREPEDDEASDETAPFTIREILALTSLRAVPGWIPVTASYAGYGLCYSIYTSYLVAALEADSGFSPAHASADFAIVGVAIAGGGILLGRLSDRVGRRPTLIWGFLVMGSCPLLVLLGNEPWVGISAALFGMTMSGLGSVVAAYVRDHTTEGSFAPAFAAVTLFFGVAQLIGPELGGFIAERSGTFTPAFIVSALAGFSGAVAAAALPRA